VAVEESLRPVLNLPGISNVDDGEIMPGPRLARVKRGLGSDLK
jgi:hypothetical protein